MSSRDIDIVYRYADGDLERFPAELNWGFPIVRE